MTNSPLNPALRETGIYEQLGELNYFVPNPLPPAPPLFLDGNLLERYGRAIYQIGQLNEMSERLPNKARFIKAYLIKEALFSSAIEGINTTIIELFTPPSEGFKQNKETQLVLNYTSAIETALNMVQHENYPIVARVILSAHEALMSGGAGAGADPGNFRKQGVHVGNLVPPPAPKVPQLIADLEKYINEDNTLPALIKAGLAHVQFETIHPFLDGNGRIGRLLIVLMLIESNLLNAPIIYPSYYFKKYHARYYDCLDRVRTHGDFEQWVSFYLEAIEESALDAHRRAKEIEALEKNIRTKFAAKDLENEILTILFEFPIINVTQLAEKLGKSYNAAHSHIKKFVAVGVLTEMTEQQRNKLFRFDAYLALLEKEYQE